MLVLTRRQNETVVIGGGDAQVVVEIVRVLGDRVKVGITAPPDVKILRGEIKEKEQGT